jgi:hypothetical protein
MALIEHFIDSSEIDRVMAFFRANKRPGHILGQDREFLTWQLSPRRCRGFEEAALSAIVLWDGSEIAGLLGVIGSQFNRDGAIVEGGWLCNLIVLPQYRAIGGWMRLMKSAHRLPLGAVGVVGFPTEIGRLYRAMGYSIRDRLYRFIHVVDPEQTERIVEGEDWRLRHASKATPLASETSITTVTALDARWDRFWERFTAVGYFGTHRDSAHMTWRYLSHPRLKHTVIVAAGLDGEIKGGAVYRIEQVRDRPERVMRLLELLALDEPTYAALLDAAKREGEVADVAFIDHYTSRSLPPTFANSGWFEESDVSNAVVPGLFQPLVKGRRSVNVGVRLLNSQAGQRVDLARDLHTVKSDGDQDRPS